MASQAGVRVGAGLGASAPAGQCKAAHASSQARPHGRSHSLRQGSPRGLAPPSASSGSSSSGTTSGTASGTAPRRGVVLLPGLGNSRGDYDALVQQLRSRGLAVQVADVARVDWLRNASGLRYASYWRGTLEPRPTVDWYLGKVEAAVEAAKREADGAPLTLLAHSAGGWLGRVYLKDFGTAGIDRLVSLGSPHQPPPEGVVDQTRGILTFCQRECPGAYHSEVEYVTVAGKWLKGAKLGSEGASLQQVVVGLGYKQVCGEAEVWGDGVVPLPSAHLEGALNIDLESVYHSPLGSVDGISSSEEEEEQQGGRPWYGSPNILDQWVSLVAKDPTVELVAVTGP